MSDRAPAASVPNQTMHSPLSSIIRRAPVTVPPEVTVREALETMNRHRIGSIIIADAKTGVPVGIFTLQDLLRRIALQDGDLAQPIANVMTAGLVSLPPEATAYHAALLMARHSLRHVVVVNQQGKLTGIVSQNDLYALQRVSIKEISTEIGTAQDIGDLAHAASEIRRLADNMLGQGVGAEQLTQFISTLNDLLTLRIIELTQAEFELPQVRWCWIALGSEGRFEQTLSTDQDNGIIFACDDASAERVRQQLLPFAQEVNRKLDACGFLLCKGNIMAGNPMWCMSLEEWRRKFSGWMRVTEPEALLFAAIFFDFRPLFGDEELSDSLRRWLLDTCAKQPLFLRFMAENALRSQPPLGILRDFVFDKSHEFPHTIDLKMFGAWPFVDSARILALMHGVPHTSTAQRLRAAMAAMRFPHDEIAAMVDSFFYIQLLRLRHQHNLRDRASGANRINPNDLNELERRILKECFKQARKLQSRLRLDFQL